MTDQEREAWNSAVESGDSSRIASLREHHLNRINAKIVTEDSYIGRTREKSSS